MTVRVRAHRRRWPGEPSGFDWRGWTRSLLERRRLGAEIVSADEQGDRELSLRLRRRRVYVVAGVLPSDALRACLSAFAGASDDPAELDRLFAVLDVYGGGDRPQ